MDAAERVFAHASPDEVGLKEVAQAAGVSHALVTHYFGTYAGLLSATLTRRVRGVRERILAVLGDVESLHRPGELLAILFDALENPVHLRLLKWRAANAAGGQTLALEDRGIALVARQVVAVLEYQTAAHDANAVEIVEHALLAIVAAAFGFAMMKAPLAAAIGKRADAELSQTLQHTIVAMLRSYLRSELGLELPK